MTLRDFRDRSAQCLNCAIDVDICGVSEMTDPNDVSFQPCFSIRDRYSRAVVHDADDLGRVDTWRHPNSSENGGGVIVGRKDLQSECPDARPAAPAPADVALIDAVESFAADASECRFEPRDE